MTWHILIIISLIMNAWASYKILDLVKCMCIVLDMFDTTLHALEVVKDRLKEVEE